jgi:hypothetical protein
MRKELDEKKERLTSRLYDTEVALEKERLKTDVVGVEIADARSESMALNDTNSIFSIPFFSLFLSFNCSPFNLCDHRRRASAPTSKTNRRDGEEDQHLR